VGNVCNQKDFNEAIFLCSTVDPSATYDCWIGLNDQASEGLYVWSDGTTNIDFYTDSSNTNVVRGAYPWADDYSQPDNDGGTEHCIEMFRDFDYELNDAICSRTEPF
jgi:hypothetical protein